MSGGHFEYKQYDLECIADSIDAILAEKPEYSDSTLHMFRVTSHMLRRTAIMVQRIDWLVSGDDGEESFHERWAEDLEKLAGDIE